MAGCVSFSQCLYAMSNDSLVVESRATASLKLIGLLTLSLIFGRYAAEPNNFSQQKVGHCWEEGVYINGRTGERRAKLIIAAAAVTKKGLLSFPRPSEIDHLILSGFSSRVWFCWLASLSFLSPPFRLRGFSPADRHRTHNRNESHENHALRINLSLLTRTLGYGMMVW